MPRKKRKREKNKKKRKGKRKEEVKKRGGWKKEITNLKINNFCFKASIFGTPSLFVLPIVFFWALQSGDTAVSPVEGGPEFLVVAWIFSSRP